MNAQQISAVKQLRKALDACGKAGLTGGVFDGQFCVWPLDETILIHATELNFFAEVDARGSLIYTYMRLDGGAGV